MRKRESAAAYDRLLRRMRRMNLKLDELLACGVREGLTDRERVEATLACSRAIADLDELLAALRRAPMRAETRPAKGARARTDRHRPARQP